MTNGLGFTVITTTIGSPGQPLAVGIMVYVAVPAVFPVAVRTWEMGVPVPSEAPETPDSTTVHSKVVPATLPFNAIEVLKPEQIVLTAGVAVATVTG